MNARINPNRGSDEIACAIKNTDFIRKFESNSVFLILRIRAT